MDNAEIDMGHVEEREIDLKQLALAVFTKWRIVLLCMIIGGMTAAIITQIKLSSSSKMSYDAIQSHQNDKEYYDRMKAMYEKWIVKALDALESGMPEKLPESTTEIEQMSYALQTLVYINSAKTSLDALKEPTIPTEIRKTSNSHIRFIRHSLFGLAGGAIVGVLALAFYIILRGYVLSSYELNCRYGLRALTVIACGKIDKLMRYGMDRAYYKMALDEQHKVAVANLSVYASGIKDLLLTGSVGETVLRELSSKLQNELNGVSVYYVADLSKNAASYETLKQHDNIVLVEKVLFSKYSEIDIEMRLLKDWKKTVVGTIVLA